MLSVFFISTIKIISKSYLSLCQDNKKRRSNHRIRASDPGKNIKNPLENHLTNLLAYSILAFIFRKRNAVFGRLETIYGTKQRI